MEGSFVWAPDPEQGYQLCTIVDVTTNNIRACSSNTGKEISSTYEHTYPADDHDKPHVPDNCGMIYLNEASLLDNLRKRYAEDLIYTYTANVLIAVNPFKVLPGYDLETIDKYRGKSLGVLPPHIYGLADHCYRDMKASKTSQSIIVSGESGAGKTESCKYIVRYLTVIGKGSTLSTLNIEERIVDANPVLESFGNSKTMRNINSSRFGKFIEIHFDSSNCICGAFISHYLLEKSRICSQSPFERNYHVFYRLCAGAPADVKRLLNLGDPESFQYLSGGVLDAIPGLDDKGDFLMLDDALTHVGITPDEKSNIWRVVAAVLHLGNAKFIDDDRSAKGGCVADSASQSLLKGVANMLGLDVNELRVRLTSRLMSTKRGGKMGTVVLVPFKLLQAIHARDAMAKAIYSNLFNWIVGRINDGFSFDASSNYVGVLDIAGFEYFQHNSFEQLCINYCNEKLQHFFNDKVLKQEQDLYRVEGIKFKEIGFLDNQDCIDLFEDKAVGVFSVLDEEAKMPRSSDSRFTSTLHGMHSDNFRFTSPKKTKLNIYKKLKDDEGFVIRHYAGAVCYQTHGFLDKNKDSLHADLLELIRTSTDSFIQQLFLEKAAPEKLKPSRKGSSGKKLALDSLGTKFRRQLNALMSKLEQTKASFIRCLKPNLNFHHNDFAGGEILSQLQCGGMVQVLNLLQGGYPSRISFSHLYNNYKDRLDAALKQLDPRAFCEALFHAMDMSDFDFQFGVSKVFFSAGKFAEFDQITVSNPELLEKLLKKVKKWMVRKRWRRAIFGILSILRLQNKVKVRAEAVLIIQKWARRFIVQIHWLPKIEASKKERIDRELAAAHEKAENERIRQLEQEQEQERQRLAEKERLRKIAEEEHRQHKEFEERQRFEAEEARKAEEQALKMREIEAKELAAIEESNRQEEARINAMIEQEHRDAELAKRLTKDEEKPQEIVEESLKEKPFTKEDKYDLSSWKYSDLKASIHTSSDIELMEACREEFHRRIKIYNSWKAKNRKKGENSNNYEGIPNSVFADALRKKPVPPKRSTSRTQGSDQHRYFRIPIKAGFVKDQKLPRGWWLAHFAGKWISRQLELRHSVTPILLEAGKNDLNMCELPLEETGLCRQKGAEITESEFEKFWLKAADIRQSKIGD